MPETEKQYIPPAGERPPISQLAKATVIAFLRQSNVPDYTLKAVLYDWPVYEDDPRYPAWKTTPWLELLRRAEAAEAELARHKNAIMEFVAIADKASERSVTERVRAENAEAALAAHMRDWHHELDK